MIDIRQFYGVIPKLSARLLPEGYAAQAYNCDFNSGGLRSIKGVSSVQDTEADTQTIYKMQSSFLEWDGVVDVAKSLVADSGDRVFYTGAGYPKDTNATLALSGSSPFPTSARRLGIPAPSNALTVTLNGTAGEDIEHSSSYVYTLVGKWADGSAVESSMSEPTAVFDVYSGITPRLTGFTDATADGAFTTHFRVYRLNPGNTGAEYQYVDEIAVTETQFDDTVTDDDLGEVLPSELWDAPPGDLSGLVATSHGIFAGVSGNTIYPSEVFHPYAFPSDYTLVTESDIVGLGYTGSMIIALTKTVPYLLIGQDPATMALQRLGYQQPCLSARSIANVPGGVIYASPDGLYSIGESGQGTNLTRKIVTRAQWNELGPEDLIGVYYDDSYFGFFAGTAAGFQLDLETGGYAPFTMTAAVYGAHYCPDDDLLYLVIAKGEGREIVSWGSGESVSKTWRSGEYTGNGIFEAGYVGADFSDGSVTLNIYTDGSLSFTTTVSSDDIFFIPGRDGGVHQVEVTGTVDVDRVILAHTYEEVANRLMNNG